ncbi:MAG TPA: division/cell wall cluster transcriptional repressor MraZ [Roseiarcus sp.]
MDRFLSHYTNRFDAKGRLSVPAPFRAVLAKDGFEGIFVHPSLDAPALDCGGARLLSEINAFLESAPLYSQEREDLATALLGASEVLRVDSEGRIVLSERLRSMLGVTDEAAFVGHGHKFQIWEPSRFAEHLEEAKARVRRLRADFGARQARAAAMGARE